MMKIRGKKYAAAVGLLAVAVLALSGCAGKKSGASSDQTTAAASTEAGATAVGATQATAQPDQTTAAETKAKAEVSQKEVEAFAEQVQEAVADRSLEAISELVSYPLYVEYKKGQSEILSNEEELMEMDPDDLFGEALTAEVAKVDTATLKMTDAGVIMGEGAPHIIFDVMDDGTLKITDIYEN